MDEAPEVVPTRQPPWKKWPIALAGPLFGLIALGVIIITIKDRNGRETKISVPDDSSVVVEAPRKNVEIKPPANSPEEARGTGGPTPSSREAGKPSVDKPQGPSSDKESSATPDDKTRSVVPSTPPKSLVNSIGMTLKLIPAGEFDMGTSPEEMQKILQIPDVVREFCIREQPRHHVRITRPFYLGATEVTRGQFKRFVEAEGYQTDAERSGGGSGWNAATRTVQERSPVYSWRDPGFEQTNEHPVLNVSWNDAVAFCGWLSRTEKVIYRLPTEAEWEYACRAGTTSLYGSGNDPESLVKVGNLWDQTLLTKLSRFRTTFWVAGPFLLQGRATATSTPRRSVSSSRMPLACTTCSAMPRSGATTGSTGTITRRAPSDDPPGLPGRRRGLLGAAAGDSLHGVFGPLSVTAGGLTSGVKTLGSVSSARSRVTAGLSREACPSDTDTLN